MGATDRPTRLAGDDLDSFVAEHDTALVEFYTEGCPKCASMEPVLGNVARVTDAAVGLVNLGDDLALADRFDVQSVPTLVIFRDGAPVAKRAEGFQSTEAVVDFIRAHTPEPIADGADSTFDRE